MNCARKLTGLCTAAIAVAFLLPNAASAVTWQLPASNLSGAGQDASGQQVATGPDGRTTVIWITSDGSNTVIQEATRPAGSNTFGAPVTLSASGQNASSPKIAIGADGRTTVVWERYDGSNWIVQASTRPAGSGSFSSPVNLSPAGKDARNPQVSIGAGGTTTVVWSLKDGVSAYHVQAAVRPAGSSTFGAAVDVSGSGVALQYPEVATAADGTTTVAWGLTDGPSKVEVSTKPSGSSTFGTPVVLSAPGQVADRPHLAVGPDGATTVVWHQSDGSNFVIQEATRPAGSSTFGAAKAVSAAGQDALDPRVAVGPKGETTIVWARSDGVNFIVQEATRPAGSSTFGTPVDLSASGQPGSRPQVAFGRTGETTVVWERNDGGNWIVQAATRPAGSSTFGTPVDLSESGQSAQHPQVAVGPDGRTTAVWYRFDGSKVRVQYVSTKPNNKFTITSSKSTGTAVVTKVRVPGAGRLSQRGTYRLSGRRFVTACTTSKTTARSGTYTLTCRLNRAALRQLRKGPLRVTVATTYTPIGGDLRTELRTVLFRSQKPSFTG